jgi:hypothetical protein
MAIKQLHLFVENKPGRVAEIAKIIGDAGIDIRALSIADTSDFGIMRMIVDKPTAAVATMQEAGLMVSVTDVIAVGMDDTPGSFAGVMAIIAQAGINVEYMYAFITREAGRANIIMRVRDADEAAAALSRAGVKVMEESEVYHL